MAQSRLGRLTDRRIRRELLRGPKNVSPPMTLFLKKNDLERPRYAVYGRRYLGGAVHRNRVKRIFRGILNGLALRLQGYDFIIIPRQNARDMQSRDLRLSVEAALLDAGILRKEACDSSAGS